MLLHQLFAATAQSSPGRVALVFEGRHCSYGELDRRAGHWAAWLQHHGVRRGDRVAVYLDNGLAFALALLATLRCGAVLVPISPAARTARLHAVMSNAGASVLISQPALRPLAEPALAGSSSVHTALWVEPGAPECEADAGDASLVDPGTSAMDLAALIYTSGSTGEPKGVMLSHGNMLAAAASVQAYLGLRADDVLAGVLPMAYSYGLYQLLLAFQVGASVAIERSFAFPVKALQNLAAEHVTVFAAVPTMLSLWLNLKNAADFVWPELRLLTNAAAALSPDHIRRLRELAPAARMVSMYGMTECKRISFLPPEQLDARPDSVGRGMPGQTHWLVDDGGQVLPHGATGEMVVQGAHVMQGYWNQPELTAQVLRPAPSGSGWALHTGDIFRSDDEGWLYFVGRRDDIIKCRGEKVAPRAVEDALHALAEVREAAVVGIPDPLFGQSVAAFIVPTAAGALTERQVIRHCMERLDAGMVPQRVVFMDALPRTDSGKVLKKALAETPLPEPTAWRSSP